MALTAVLVDSAPNRLRYLLSQNGVVSSPPSPVVDGTVTIPNDGGVTPDLRTDLGLPRGGLAEVVRARLDGYRSLIAAGTPLTQAQARAILNSDDPTRALLTNNNAPRAVMNLAPRTGLLNWNIDANVDAQGDPVVVAQSTIGAGVGTCYLDIYYRHTMDL